MLARGLVALVAASAVASETASCELHDQSCVLEALIAEKPEALELLQVEKKKKIAKSMTVEGDSSRLKDTPEVNPEENAIDSSETESMISGDEKTESKSQSTDYKAGVKHSEGELPTAALIESEAPNFEKKLNEEAAKEDVTAAKTTVKTTAKTVKTTAKAKTSLLESEEPNFEKKLNEEAAKEEVVAAKATAAKTTVAKTAAKAKTSLLESEVPNFEKKLNEEAAKEEVTAKTTAKTTAKATAKTTQKKTKASLLESNRKDVDVSELSASPEMESEVSSENDETSGKSKTNDLPTSQSALVETGKNVYEDDINSPETDAMITSEETEGETSDHQEKTSVKGLPTHKTQSVSTSSDELPQKGSTAGKTGGQK